MSNISKLLIVIIVVVLIIFSVVLLNKTFNKEDLNLPVINTTENEENKEEIKENDNQYIPKYVQMYLMLFDNIMNEDKGLNGGIEFISIDVKSLDKEYMDPEIKGTTRVFDINENDEKIIVEYMKKYHEDIKTNTFEELKAQGRFDEEALVLDGILISVSNIEIVSEDNYLISMTKYRSGLGAIFPKYSVKYIDGNWEYEIVSMAIS